MAIVNHAKQEINAKIVYCGQPGAGKATSLRYIYDRIKPGLRGEFRVQPTAGSTLHFFDFSPFEQPVLNGYRLRFHVYTLNGRVDNPAAWKMTLKGADGLVFVMDSATDALSAAQQSVAETEEYLNAYGVGLSDIPVVLQVNKAERSSLSAAEQASRLGLDGRNGFLTTATSGNGVLEVLSMLSRDIMTTIRESNSLSQPGEIDQVEEVNEVDDEEHEATENIALKIVSDSEMTPGRQVESLESACQPDPELEPNNEASDLKITLSNIGLSAHGNSIRVPLEVSESGKVRHLVLTISIGSE